MLYTRKGDGGTTKTFGSDQRISKSSAKAEALGALDEINSFLGIVKVLSKQYGYTIEIDGTAIAFDSIVHDVQETLFIIQAEVAGFPKGLAEEKITHIENIIDTAEKILPPIKTFFISGGTDLAAHFDVARTLARRAERRVVQVHEEGTGIGATTRAYLNRLSSLLYALARLSNHISGVIETPPSYS